MGDISKHFSRSEFECRCGCGFNTVDVELIDALEKVRGYFDTPITVTSGCRCSEYNDYIGGSKNSQHLLGRAADIVVNLVPNVEVQDFLKSEYPDSMGIGSYDNFTHVDSRSTKARW